MKALQPSNRPHVVLARPQNEVSDFAVGSSLAGRPAAIVGRLRTAVLILAEHGAGDVGQALSMWLDGGTSITFEAACGLPADRRSRARLVERDGLLLCVATRWFPHLRGRPLADAVAAAARRYEGSAWPRDRRAHRRPDGIQGDLFDVLLVGEMPGEARLRQIFNGLAG